MITAIEIRNQQFSKAIRGYNEEEVKNFLYRLSQDYENLYSENAKLKEKIQKLEYDLDKYYKMEETMNNSLILAQQTAEGLRANAKKEADLILEESKGKIAEILMIYQEIIKRMNIFGVEIKAQVGAHLEMLDKNQARIEDLSTFFYSKDLKDLLENLEEVSLDKTEME
ncbi:MAG: DivIVA domain-containing protein [Syntrophomonadaceae bacterium]|nr:DivIVA domain-containing protein [Syntrophomonadaceae bacterium]